MRTAVGWLSDPINSQGVNKQLTARRRWEREGKRERGNRFSVPLPLVAAWLGRQPRKEEGRIRSEEEGAPERNEKCADVSAFRYRLCEMAEK